MTVIKMQDLILKEQNNRQLSLSKKSDTKALAALNWFTKAKTVLLEHAISAYMQLNASLPLYILGCVK